MCCAEYHEQLCFGVRLPVREQGGEWDQLQTAHISGTTLSFKKAFDLFEQGPLLVSLTLGWNISLRKQLCC